MTPADNSSANVALRTTRAGDLGAIVSLHGILYAQEYRFDATFEAYVAGPLAEFVRANSPRERLWLAERDGRLVGCIAIVAAVADTAQLRWFLVDPSARGTGLGKRLLNEAVNFARTCGYTSIILWTVGALTTAARLYEGAGFRKVEEHAGHLWGVDVIEQQYEMTLN